LDAAAATRLGAAAVTVEEVITAISHTAPGKAPGLDGEPGELFRCYKVQLGPLLAALYSAIGTTQSVPAGFLDGVILPVLKPGGAAADPAAFRPIQLLNYDYRLLAKILANRLLAVAGDVIHPAQSAFFSHTSGPCGSTANTTCNQANRCCTTNSPHLRALQQHNGHNK
jgi:hypothetical protein